MTEEVGVGVGEGACVGVTVLTTLEYNGAVLTYANIGITVLVFTLSSQIPLGPVIPDRYDVKIFV